MRVVVLGAGFGGLELAWRLSKIGEVETILIDATDGFVFGFSKLDVMFGRATADHAHHAYADLAMSMPAVRFVHAELTAIDPSTRRVETTAGGFDADVLVVALGAQLDVEATPGLAEAGCEFYTEAGAARARERIEAFDGGDVIVGVSATPFKCPPAPSETALMMHDWLVRRGLRERSTITLAIPLPAPVPPSPAASAALLEAFAERGIAWMPNTTVRRLDASRNVAVTAEDKELPFDLYLGVPVHRVPRVVEESGMCVDGWIPVDPRTLETRFADVFALGDVSSVGTPKAGVFAEGQAAALAAALINRIRGHEVGGGYGGTGTCYLEFGDDLVAKVEVTFLPGRSPEGRYEGPSEALAASKVEFGTERVRRWFGREWEARAR